MKSYIYPVLLLVCGIFAAQCSKSTDAAPVDPDNQNYTSYWYYNYEALDIVTHETLGLTTANEFNPGTVAQRGDTLFIANTGTPSGLIVFDKKNKRPLKTIKTWTVNGAEKSFADNSPIYAIAPTADRVYVSEKSSCIHVFALPEMNYLTCIGTGSSDTKGVKIMNVQALAVKDGLLYTRDKTGQIGIYKEELITPENYQKVSRYKQAGPGAGDSSNNNFAAHYMEVDKEGHIMLTGYTAKSIRVLDTSLVNDEFQNGTNLDIDDRTWALSFNPKSFAMTDERLYVTGNNNVINVYDFGRKEWVKTLKSIKGYTFTTPERIYRESNETFWVSDIGAKKLVRMGVFKGEIREYARINDRLIEVKSAMTRHGQEQESFVVDITTHEIVDPSEL